MRQSVVICHLVREVNVINRIYSRSLTNHTLSTYGKLENLLNLFLYALVAEYLVESGITLQAQTT